MRGTRHALATAAVTLAAGHTLGCWAIYNREADVDRAPVVNHGAGATIIYPNRSAPPHPGNLHPREAGYGQGAMAPQSPPPGSAPSTAPMTTPSGTTVPAGTAAPGVAVPPPEYTSRTGSGSGSGTGTAGNGLTMLGGTEVEETGHIKINEEPKWLKYLALPFAVVAAPFKYGADQAAGEPAPAPPVPRNADQARPELHPARATTDYETAQLQNMERELAQRAGAPSGAPAPAVTAPAYSPPAPSAGGGFADELAALRARANSGSAPQAAPAPAPPVAPAPPAIASAPPVSAAPLAPSGGQVDRDGDGRPDQWITRENGAIAREAFDENFDGQPDRTLVYDAASHQVVSIEEDANFDGRSDAWTALRGGQVIGRRVDGNADGQIDSWSIYRDGVITRLERDANGDGFRDHVAYYQSGRLAREERDDDADGRTDLIKYFDDGERVERVEEDADGDGEMDVVSHYEDGRLTRREVLDASVLGLGPREGAERE
jgi:hypothetical protein